VAVRRYKLSSHQNQENEKHCWVIRRTAWHQWRSRRHVKGGKKMDMKVRDANGDGMISKEEHRDAMKDGKTK
jgi:hypothetical protein